MGAFSSFYFRLNSFGIISQWSQCDWWCGLVSCVCACACEWIVKVSYEWHLYLLQPKTTMTTACCQWWHPKKFQKALTNSQSSWPHSASMRFHLLNFYLPPAPHYWFRCNAARTMLCCSHTLPHCLFNTPPRRDFVWRPAKFTRISIYLLRAFVLFFLLLLAQFPGELVAFFRVVN